MTNYFIGVDPGKNGGVASLRFNDNDCLDQVLLGDLDLLRRLVQQTYDGTLTFRFYCERVHSMPGQGVASTFEFGRQLGLIQGLLSYREIEPVMVTPVEWQRFYVPLGITGNRKNMLKEKAKELFPTYAKQITLKNCDAILIAHYGKYYYKEKI